MPTQVQSLITPTYTAIVDVSSDTEVLTQAQLTNTAVALGNRIEFVRQLAPLATATPERFFSVREDFSTNIGAYDQVNQVVHGDHNWDAVQTGTPSINFDGGTVKNPGRLRMDLPTSSSFLVNLGALGGNPMRFDSFSHVDMVVKVNDNVANVSTSFQIGLASAASISGTDLLLLTYRATHATWDLFSKKSSALTVTNLPAYTANKFVTVRFIRDPATGNIAVEFDGVVATTVLAANVPLGTCTFGWIALTTGADPGLMSNSVDFVNLLGDTGNALRSGF